MQIKYYDFCYLLRNWEIIWRSARLMKLCRQSSPTPLSWWSVSQPRPHRGESAHIWLIKIMPPLHRASEGHSLRTMLIDMFTCVFRILLSDDELQQLEESCDMSLELSQSKLRIYEYVESKMSFIAPNLSVIVGASTAAKIMGERCRKIHFRFK